MFQLCWAVFFTHFYCYFFLIVNICNSRWLIVVIKHFLRLMYLLYCISWCWGNKKQFISVLIPNQIKSNVQSIKNERNRKVVNWETQIEDSFHSKTQNTHRYVTPCIKTHITLRNINFLAIDDIMSWRDTLNLS